MKRPTSDQIDLAIQWLDVNEGDNGEADACQAVARWLEHLDQQAFERDTAKLNRVPVRLLRKAMSKASA